MSETLLWAGLDCVCGELIGWLVGWLWFAIHCYSHVSDRL